MAMFSTEPVLKEIYEHLHVICSDQKIVDCTSKLSTISITEPALIYYKERIS